MIDKDDKEFFQKSLEVHKIGMMREFTRKLSKYKTREELINFMSDFIKKNSDEINFDIITKELRSLNSKIIYESPDDGIVLAEIKDYETSKKVGSQNWCIVTGKGSWNSYTSGTNKQFFMWDFSVDRSDSNFMIGFTTNNLGQITHIHDKFDASLRSKVPEKVRNLLIKVDFSVNPFEYKNELLDKIESSNVERIDDESDNNIIILQIENYSEFSLFRQASWGWYNPISDLSKTYIIFDFKYELTSKNFCLTVNVYQYGPKIEYEVKDNIGDLNTFGTDNLIDVIKPHVDLLVPQDVTEVYDKWKTEYLDKIEPYVKGTSKLSKWSGEAKYINTSSDQNSTGGYWLFELDDDSFFDNFSSQIIKKWSVMNNNNIVNFNMYVLIDIEKDFNDPNFIRYICAREGTTTIKYNLMTDNVKKYKREELPNDIQKLVDDNYIKLKLSSDYQKEIREKQQEILSKAQYEYSDSRIDLYGKILFDYLIETENLDEGDYMEYDENDNPIGFEEDVYQKVLIPNGNHYGSLLSFQIYSLDMVMKKYGGGSDEWCLGTDDEADDAAYEYQENLWDELGIESFFNTGYVNSYINEEELADYLMYGEEDYLREDILENPDSYNIEKNMIEGVKEKIDEANEELDKVVDKKEKVEERLEQYREWYKKKVEQVFNMIQNSYDDETGDETERTKRLKTIEERLEKRFEKNEERYEDLIEKIEARIEEIEEKIEEMEDEDNNEYWEYSEYEIENCVDGVVEDRKEEIKNDPIDYLKNSLGYDGKTINNLIKDYINKDELFKDAISDDGRGNSISSYDGNENEHSYNGEIYYIYKIN